MSDSKMTPPTGDEPMSVRECRLILERLLVVAGTDPGSLAATRDALLDAQILGVPVLASIHEDSSLLAPRPTAAAVRLDGQRWKVDAHGQYALLTLPTVADLLVAGAALDGHSEVVLDDGLRSEDLAVLTPLLAARSVDVAITAAPEKTVLIARRRPIPDDEALVAARRRAQAEGFLIPGTVWLDLYQRSNGALVPESADTRRHAGHQDVDEAGNFIRQMDDDADVEHALRQRTGAESA